MAVQWLDNGFEYFVAELQPRRELRPVPSLSPPSAQTGESRLLMRLARRGTTVVLTSAVLTWRTQLQMEVATRNLKAKLSAAQRRLRELEAQIADGQAAVEHAKDTEASLNELLKFTTSMHGVHFEV